MSGHSKWSTIKRKKALVDAKRSKIWTKVIKEIQVAARIGGGEPSGNPRLRLALDKARAANMTKDAIKRAIDKGTGGGGGDNFEDVVYEGYGPAGVAIVVECMTDNRTRTVGEVRHAFEKFGGNLGSTHSVSWMFKKRGIIHVLKASADEEKIMEVALEAGADDVRDDEENWEVVTPPEAFPAVLDTIKGLGVEPPAAEIALLPKNYVKLEGKAAQQMVKLMEILEEHDDTKKVWTNADIEEKEIEASLA